MTVPVAVIALLVARMEYRNYGKLTTIGVLLLCLMLILPNFVLEFATRYRMPGTLLDYIGVIIGMFGLILCGLGMKAFRSVPKIFCLDAGQLTVSGVYRWSRNPQYVGWFLFLIGFAMNDWSLWCLTSLTVVAVSLHLLVLIEEKHLRNEFGQLYVEFCRKVPRYFPLPRILQTALFNILLVFLCQTTMLNGNSGHKEASICHFSMNSNAVMSRG